MTLKINCGYSTDWLQVTDVDPSCVELAITSQHEDLTQSVFLEERDKVEQLHKALGDWLAAGNPSHGETLARWWGLSYASWLTLPRVLMQAMPDEWQERAGVLLAEYSAAFPVSPELTIGVTARGLDGKLVAMPQWLNNYRHPNRAEIDKCRGGV